ncbi:MULTISPECIES: hypothetical protein [Vagococcus]|uniref:hypothetical protein n=1 Tax=Vagococcus TaxID=2737 RepID=UPI0011C48AE2|nr:MULTISPECIES: hypothetical protein [Vagococcus]
MSNLLVSIGSTIESSTVHHKKVVRTVELILKHTVLIRDEFDETHLVLIETLAKHGLDVDDETSIYKTKYSRR